MIQEYLLKDNSEIEAIAAYKIDDTVQVHIFSSNDDDCRYVQFSVDRENENTAKRLSYVDKYIIEHFKVIRLEDGCSAYFNKRLYIRVSKFEHKLRKLLYLASAICKDDTSAKNITDLELKDFGQIFSLLFIDSDFADIIKENIKKRNKEDFSKKKVLTFIESTDENVLWEKLLGKDTAPILRNSFNQVRSYRNDVMHSHHIDWEKYKIIQKLYDDINGELDELIQNIDITENEIASRMTFNHILGEALQAQKLRAKMENVVREGLSLYTLSPEWTALQDQMKNWGRLKANIYPGFQEMNNISKGIKNGMPKDLLESYSRLSRILHFSDNTDLDERKDSEQDSFSNSNGERII